MEVFVRPQYVQAASAYCPDQEIRQAAEMMPPPHGLDLGSLEVFVQLWRVLVHCPGQEIRQLADRDWQMMAALEVFVTFLFVHNMSTI